MTGPDALASFGWILVAFGSIWGMALFARIHVSVAAKKAIRETFGKSDSSILMFLIGVLMGVIISGTLALLMSISIKG